MSGEIATFFDGRITLDPQICNGKPTLRGKRIAVQTILEFLSAGDGEQEILEQYPGLEPEDIKACLQLRCSAHGPPLRSGSGSLRPKFHGAFSHGRHLPCRFQVWRGSEYQHMHDLEIVTKDANFSHRVISPARLTASRVCHAGLLGWTAHGPGCIDPQGEGGPP